MESEDDIQPLIYDDVGDNRDIHLELTSQALGIDPDLEQVVYGYRKSGWRTVLVYIISTLTCGVPCLLFHWWPTWLLYATSVRACFQLADQVLVVETYQKKCKSFYIHKILDKNVADSNGLLNKGFQDEFGEKKEPIDSAEDLCTPIHLDDGSTLNIHRYRYFRHKKQTLIWDGARAHWTRLAGIESGATCAMLQARGARAPSTEKRVRMLNIYGLNEIKVPVQSIMTLVLLEVFNPFYVFQLFTIAVWLAEPYYYYCVAVVLMSTFGVATSVIQTKKNQQSLRATVEAHDTVQLWDGRVVDSARVAPGDIVVLPQRGCTLHFDAALLTAAAIVNESMLTGESVPVTKTALLRTDQPFDLKQHASSVLFCGTRVIQTRYYNNEPVKALVLRTGYNTSKGQLVRSILYPVPADFKFDRDSYKFIIILAGIALVGLAYTVALKAYRALTPGDIAIKALDIITIVIPPALPAAMTVGRLYAVARLKNARIACLNTRAVNVSGSLDCVCFDKTGTLTEDGLDMWGVVATSAATSPPRLGRPLRDPAQLNDLHDLKLGMACCHSLTLLDGELAGDPLDLKMFESTGWKLEEPDVPEHSNYDILTPTIVKPKKTANINVDDIHMPLELGIVQQHQFVSSLQRSSVCVRMLGEDVLRVYCKGAPEMLRTLCRPHTVPDNLNEVLNSYAEKGYRVIAVATRILEVNFQQLQRMTREEVERELEFLGLVIMENRLKAATTGIIRELKEANIHVVMITGDNIHTAVSVARECGILANDERVVVLHADTGGHTPIIYCESTLHGATVGRRTALQREWRSVDSGRGSWRGSGSNSCELDAEAAGDVKYKVVMTGDTWHVLREQYPCMVGRVIARGAVFARMTSDQKQQLIVEYQALGYYVVPDNLNEVLNSYAEKGYRVIAVATRILEVNFQQLQRMTRDEVERELEFLGLVIMENRLKAATTGIIRELKEANIHVVMITGDNIHTAVSVARECGILASDERVVVLHADTAGHTPVIYCESTLHGATVGRRTPLQREWRSVDSGRGSWRGSGSNSCELDAEAAGDVKYKVVMTGDTWHVLREQYPCMVGRVIARGAVFARMTSDQKQQLIVEYQALGYYVGMCGDGANDCGALRAAHTGISLSELESSVAAPFTSADPDIVCVSRVLREGRAALTTSFGVFKFMISYSLTEFLSVAFLYYFDSNLTDFQFLYIDVALIVNFAFFFGMTEAYTGKLCKVPPLTSLLGLVPLLSLIGQLVLIAVAQFLSYYALTFFPWYERHTYEGDEANECWENYAIFTVSMFQYITMSIVFSHGSPYRRSIVTNKQLMISILIMLGICIYITVAPAQWLAEFLQLRMPLNALMCYIILALAAFNFVIALFFERVIVQFLMERKEMIPKFLKEKRVMKTPHLLLKRQLTDMDYLDCDSLIKYEKEIYSAISDSSSGKGS